ncbi:MAG: DUF2344 domain-containing protein [Candidatus Lindowbacteria bacterium]|nr:DUF2344 domain-containing protein [Candidatus Lindowbacteria bacterium]
MWTYRAKYAKLGHVRFISHLDVMRALMRALNRSGIPVAYSEGFNPHQKLSMGPALPLGYESKCELADVMLSQALPLHEFRERLSASMPKGLDLLETGRVLSSSVRLCDASSACYVIRLDGEAISENVNALVKKFLEKDAVLIERVRKEESSVVNIRQFVADLAEEAGQDFRWLRVEITMGGQGTCNASEVAQAVLNLPPERAKCLRIVRTDIKFGGRSLQVKTNEEIPEEDNFKK